MKHMLYKLIGVYAIAASVFLTASLAEAQVIDHDGDGLSDDDEIAVYFTNPESADTDKDGYLDSWEVKQGYSPNHGNRTKLTEVDSDNDKLTDAQEIALRTNLTHQDTDNDGHKDGDEVFAGFNPLAGGGDRDVKRHAEVDLNTQQLSYFLNDVKIGSMPVSSGKALTPTPVGEFEILRKVPVVHYRGPDYDLPNTKWNLEFKRSYYLHGAYWHNQFGIRPMSHGCVNIAYKDVEKLYTFMDVGDKVVITGKAPLVVKTAGVKKSN